MTAESDWDSAFSALVKAGAHVRTYKDSTKVLYIHAKAVVADAGSSDEQMFVGSENFSAASLRRNRELGIRTTNKSVIAAVAAVLAADYAGGDALQVMSRLPALPAPLLMAGHWLQCLHEGDSGGFRCCCRGAGGGGSGLHGEHHDHHRAGGRERGRGDGEQRGRRSRLRLGEAVARRARRDDHAGERRSRGRPGEGDHGHGGRRDAEERRREPPRATRSPARYSADRSSWHSTWALNVSQSYTVTATAVSNGGGQAAA